MIYAVVSRLFVFKRKSWQPSEEAEVYGSLGVYWNSQGFTVWDEYDGDGDCDDAGKVHGSLARAGKVRGQTPKVAKQDKKKKPTGRAHKRMQYNRRFVTAGMFKGNSNFFVSLTVCVFIRIPASRLCSWIMLFLVVSNSFLCNTTAALSLLVCSREAPTFLFGLFVFWHPDCVDGFCYSW